jgi:hypothetical protein
VLAGAYIYRILSLVGMAFFLGTMYLQLSLKTDNMTEIAGGIFYGVWVTLFVVVGGTGIQVTNRLSFQLDVRSPLFRIFSIPSDHYVFAVFKRAVRRADLVVGAICGVVAVCVCW